MLAESVTLQCVTSCNRIRITLSVVLCSFLLALAALPCPAATLDDLKKLEIICFVPSYLPEGFKLKKVEITYDEIQEYEDKNRPLPLYSIVYENDRKATFSIESAREGIGDRNIMPDEENPEETEIASPFGPMYLIYRPKGKTGRKIEIIANWAEDANMNAENGKGAAHPTLGRFHGFSATGITVAEFTKIINSLHPINPNSPATKPSALSLRIHPKVFNMIDCWISDSESPVVSEINLDAVELNRNQFNHDDVKPDGEWVRCPVPESKDGFMRYRVLESKGNRYKVEYQENGGGSLTTASIIEFTIEKREIRRDNKPVTIRVLHVLSYASKAGN
jgi:hypothetical protein